jgi:hypothetical protein
VLAVLVLIVTEYLLGDAFVCSAFYKGCNITSSSALGWSGKVGLRLTASDP